MYVSITSFGLNLGHELETVVHAPESFALLCRGQLPTSYLSVPLRTSKHITCYHALQDMRVCMLDADFGSGV